MMHYSNSTIESAPKGEDKPRAILKAIDGLHYEVDQLQEAVERLSIRLKPLRIAEQEPPHRNPDDEVPTTAMSPVARGIVAHTDALIRVRERIELAIRELEV